MFFGSNLVKLGLYACKVVMSKVVISNLSLQIEGALESTPQLLLQLYIIVMYTQEQTNWFTYLSVFFSFMRYVLHWGIEVRFTLGY